MQEPLLVYSKLCAPINLRNSKRLYLKFVIKFCFWEAVQILVITVIQPGGSSLLLQREM